MGSLPGLTVFFDESSIRLLNGWARPAVPPLLDFMNGISDSQFYSADLRYESLGLPFAIHEMQQS